MPGAVVGTVGKGFEPQGQTKLIANGLGRAVVTRGHQHQRQAGIVGGDRLNHGAQLRGISHHVVVHRTVGFDVADVRPLGAAYAVQCANLVMQQVLQFLRRVGHGAPTEARKVLIRRVRADQHIVRQRQAHSFAHDPRITGVKAACDVCAINKWHHLGIQAQGPVAKAFANVAVQ